MSVAVGSSLENAVRALTSADVFAFDTETSGLDPYRHVLKGVSLSVGSAADQTWWFPFRGDGALSQVQVLRALAPILGDPQKMLVGSDVRFDLKFMALHAPDVPVRCRLADTVVADWLVNENRQRHGLKPLAKELLGVQMVTYKEAARHDGGLFPEAFADYAKEDARRVLEVWRVLEPLLEQEGVTKLFHEVEMQIVRAVVEMELTGVAIDLAFLKEYQGRMEAQRDAAGAEIQKVIGHPVDLASPEKVSRLLFEELRILPLDGMAKGKSGYYSTDDANLSRIKHPVVSEVLKWRHAAHAIKTYCAPYSVRTKTEPRIRAEFKQPGTVAGRFTSEQPNMQQVAPEVKPLFISSPEMRLICGDFNQLQFRIVGHYAQRLLVDKKFIGRSVVAEAYRAGMDLHTKTQQEMGFKERKPAKEVNFAFIFGRGWRSFGEATQKSDEEAERYYRGFHDTYPEVRLLADLFRKQICEQGFVQSIAGRRRHFPEMKGVSLKDKRAYWFGWVAWNAVVQGAESDIVRITMRNLHRALEKHRAEDVRWRQARLLIQVHDELVMEAPEAIADEAAALMKSCGESAVRLAVPVIMEVGTGRSWKDAKH